METTLSLPRETTENGIGTPCFSLHQEKALEERQALPGYHNSYAMNINPRPPLNQSIFTNGQTDHVKSAQIPQYPHQVDANQINALKHSLARPNFSHDQKATLSRLIAQAKGSYNPQTSQFLAAPNVTNANGITSHTYNQLLQAKQGTPLNQRVSPFKTPERPVQEQRTPSNIINNMHPQHAMTGNNPNLMKIVQDQQFFTNKMQQANQLRQTQAYSNNSKQGNGILVPNDFTRQVYNANQMNREHVNMQGLNFQNVGPGRRKIRPPIIPGNRAQNFQMNSPLHNQQMGLPSPFRSEADYHHCNIIKQRFGNYLRHDQALVTDPDYDRPFQSQQDMIDRLLAYHLFSYPLIDKYDHETEKQKLDDSSDYLTTTSSELAEKVNNLLKQDAQNSEKESVLFFDRLDLQSIQADHNQRKMDFSNRFMQMNQNNQGPNIIPSYQPHQYQTLKRKVTDTDLMDTMHNNTRLKLGASG